VGMLIVDSSVLVVEAVVDGVPASSQLYITNTARRQVITKNQRYNLVPSLTFSYRV
jgi:hypothetical protein